METQDIIKIHKQILDTYHKSIKPILNKYTNSDINTYDIKDDGIHSPSLVTKADKEINEILTNKLLALINESSVISEEGESSDTSTYTFVIDPIDGTHEFVRNLDNWGISIGLCKNELTIYAIIFYPNCKTEYYYAIKDFGTFDSEENKITPKEFFAFKPNIVAAPSSRKIGRNITDFTKGKMLSFGTPGSAVYLLYMLLRGGADIGIYDGLNIWDVLGCAFIAEQAGLVVEWASGIPNFRNQTNIKTSLHTLIIYKPDFEKKLLIQIKDIVTTSLLPEN